MIFCKELNKEFSTEKDLFKALRENKKEIVSMKKADIMKSIDKGVSINAKPIDVNRLGTTSKGIITDESYYYVAVNSTNILDSHKDLHVNGIWNKTVKEQQGKNYLVDSHILTMKSTIVRKEHIEMFTARVPFSAIGKSYEGETEVLIYKFKKSEVRDSDIKDWLESGDAIESSVRMKYTDVDLAMNSTDSDDEKELKNFNDYRGVIANKDEFEEEIRYFWIVKQAQNVSESSLVPFGSNPATGLMNSKEAVSNTSTTIEPSVDTQKTTINYIINNFKLD